MGNGRQSAADLALVRALCHLSSCSTRAIPAVTEGGAAQRLYSYLLQYICFFWPVMAEPSSSTQPGPTPHQAGASAVRVPPMKKRCEINVKLTRDINAAYRASESRQGFGPGFCASEASEATDTHAPAVHEDLKPAGQAPASRG